MIFFTLNDVQSALLTRGINEELVYNKGFAGFLSRLINKKSFKGIEIDYLYSDSNFVLKTHLKKEVYYCFYKEYLDGEKGYLVLSKVDKIYKLKSSSLDSENQCFYQGYGPLEYFPLDKKRTRK